MLDTLKVKKVEIKNVEVLNTSMLDKFYSFLDVSTSTLRSYRSGIKQFIAYLNIQNVVMPTRENVLMFKKSLM